MTVHALLPLVAFLMNVCLAGLAVVRNPSSRLNRAFVNFVAGMALWNVGVFMLRGAPDKGAAHAWEVVIHVGVIALPAFYYHFVLIFLDSTSHHRRSLAVTYGLSAAFMALNVGPLSSLFIADVSPTFWGWAPKAGPLYLPFVVFLNAILLYGLRRLSLAHATAQSSFARNRIALMLLGTAVSVLGGFIDIIRFLLARVAPWADVIYPVGIPANMIFALMLGLSIVRYRMFNVNIAVKRGFVYAAAWALITAILAAVTRAVERYTAVETLSTVWAVAPLGVLITLLLTPLGQRLEGAILRLVFSRRRGCYEALVDLSKRTSGLLDSEALAEVLVRGLVRGVPVSHCALLACDDAHKAFVMRREETATGERAGVSTIDADGLVIGCLERWDDVLVKDEACVNPKLLRHFAADPAELDAIHASLLVPIRLESKLVAVLLVGEKLSGEIFNADELEVLSMLATQAAVAMENARLYEQAERERRRLEVLYRLSNRLASVHETDELLSLIVNEAARLLGAEVGALRLVEEKRLVLKAATDSPVSAELRPDVAVDESLTGAVVATNRAVAVEDVLEDPRYDPVHRRLAERLDLHGFLGVPLRTDGSTLGVLYVYSRRRRRFLAEEVSLLSAFADQASLILEKERLSKERKQAEEALRQGEKLATMGQLLAGVAHEMNNPLTVIVGYCALLRGRLAGSPHEKAAREIDAAAARCTRIVRNFLALARKHTPERQQVTLNEIVTQAIELMAYAFRIDSVEVTADLAADLPELWADPHQLQEVIVNLMTNAHHAMRDVEGPRRLTLVTRYDAARQVVVLRISDTGPGVPAELRPRIFEPFFTTKPVGQGTGLGLSLCHGMVTSHGGTITLENVRRPGATFRIELPVDTVPVADREPVAEPPDAIRGKHILIVDDEPGVVRLLSEMLKTDQHVVDTASSGTDALARLAEHRYDLVITDMRMPELDGPGLYREVERRFADHTPFVFITGDILGPETIEFLATTRMPRVGKPFVVDEIRRAIDDALHAPAVTG